MTKWINGYPDGTFLPDNDITRAEAVTLVNNVLRRAPDADHMLDSMISGRTTWDTSAWYYEAMQEATNSHDYDMFEGAEYETWTALEENRDWAALEQDWMNCTPRRRRSHVIESVKRKCLLLLTFPSKTGRRIAGRLF